jgi:hypothetical protein
MSSRDYLKHLVANTSPLGTGRNLGDEVFDPISNKLYKIMAVNGTTVSAVEIPTLARSQTPTSNTTGTIVVTGGIGVSGTVYSDIISVSGIAVDTSNTFTTSSISQVTIDSFSTSIYRSAKYFVQMTSSTSHHVIELSLVHDDTNVYLAQYGEVFTNASLGTFDVSITSGIANLLFTATNAVTKVKLIRRSITTA